jgi:hypothetical protein
MTSSQRRPWANGQDPLTAPGAQAAGTRQISSICQMKSLLAPSPIWCVPGRGYKRGRRPPGRIACSFGGRPRSYWCGTPPRRPDFGPHWRGLSFCHGPLVASGHAPRVVVFVDYQNVYRAARASFGLEAEPHWEGRIDPVALARRILEKDRHERELLEVRVYRGRPDSTKDPKATCGREGRGPPEFTGPGRGRGRRGRRRRRWGCRRLPGS